MSALGPATPGNRTAPWGRKPKYAETHAGAYRRIESVAEAYGKLRVLNLKDEGVRQAIAAAENAASLFNGPLATDY